MAKLSMLMLAIAAVATFFQMSSAQSTQVTCYQCDSVSNGNCADTFKSDSINTCNGYQCFKTVASTTGVTITTRGCSPIFDSSNNGKCLGGGVGGVASGNTCYCNSNNCNAAAGIYPGHVTGILALTAALVMAYMGRRLL